MAMSKNTKNLLIFGGGAALLLYLMSKPSTATAAGTNLPRTGAASQCGNGGLCVQSIMCRFGLSCLPGCFQGGA